MITCISILVSIFFVVLLFPVRLLQSNQLKRVAHDLNYRKLETKVNTHVTILEKISHFGVKLVKPLRVSFTSNKYSRLSAKLSQAGLSERFNIESFMGLKVALGVLGAVYSFVLGLMTEIILIKWLLFLLIVALFFWPDLWLENKIKLRRLVIQKEMPFVLSSMAVIVESGMSLLQAIKEVSRIRDGALVEEFNFTLLEIELGVSRVEAFERMINRVQVTELSVFLSALIQSIEKGSYGIAKLLKKQSDEMWMKRKEKARTLAEKASIKLFLPLLFFVLPAMMIFILTPAVLSLLTMFK